MADNVIAFPGARKPASRAVRHFTDELSPEEDRRLAEIIDNASRALATRFPKHPPTRCAHCGRV